MKSLILANLILFSEVKATEEEEQLAKTWKQKNCSPMLPNLSVGDFNISEANFANFKE